jgi:uncharacterized protein (TIGR02001 family)
MRKISLKTALLATAMTSLSATAALADEAATTWEDDLAGMFSATFSFNTDYMFRGVSQTQGDVAYQGSFDWSWNGLYAGVWASNVDFAYFPFDDGAKVETDYYAGYNGTIDKFSYGVGALYYTYPGANDTAANGLHEYNYVEAKASLGYDFGVAAVTASVYGSPQTFGGYGKTIYYNGAVSVPLTFITIFKDPPVLDGWFGYSTFIGSAASVNGVTLITPNNYADWSIGLTVPVAGFKLGFRYTDTNIKVASATYVPFDASPSEENSAARFIFSISRTF